MTAGVLCEDLRVCAFCPNPCRITASATSEAYLETRLPSALAYLALAVHENHVRADAAVTSALSETHVAARCRPACVYGFDVPRDLDAFVASLAVKNGPE